MKFTINQYFSKQNSRCGYCKGTKCSISHGMHSYTMFPEDYQELIDRGWRRSGLYCYKPLNNETCCPCYTIKCDALEFKLNKSHKKILKRMTRFLRDGKKDKNEETDRTGDFSKDAVGSCVDIDEDDCGGGTDKQSASVGGINDEPREPKLPIPNINFDVIAAANQERHEEAQRSPEHFDDQVPTEVENPVIATETECASKSSCDGSNQQRKKAKTIRLERRQAKLAAKGIEVSNCETSASKKQKVSQEKTLADYFADASANDKHKLQVILIPPNKKHVTDEAFNLYKKYQLLVHNDDPNRLTPSSLERFCYKSPVKYTKPRSGPQDGYGSFHQQYWLDDKLIAVGVIDILPHCVSSVYFFYDPDYSFLSLGTYGSLREIDLVQQLAKKVPALKYYYMGFYIHSCPKMRYKGRLEPSYLLCPEAYTWHLLTDETRRKLDESKYQRLNSNTDAQDVENFQTSDLSKVMLLYDNAYLTYHRYIQSLNIPTIDNMLDAIRSRIYKKITGDDDDRDLIIEYGKLVGKSLAHRMLYVKT
uniref:Arginyl-tRNA--protein transferase 1 n=1 Tax=Ceratitis capitata TaxID=7213 RepID=W8C8L4_CERCA